MICQASSLASPGASTILFHCWVRRSVLPKTPSRSIQAADGSGYVPVDQAVGDLDPLSTSLREVRLDLGTPVGFGEKSANVTLRKLFETYGNIRPAREYPGVKTPYSGRGIDLVVQRGEYPWHVGPVPQEVNALGDSQRSRPGP